MNDSDGIKPERYECGACGYVYDPKEGIPEQGIAPGTPFSELPLMFMCPLCGLGKGVFKRLED